MSGVTFHLPRNEMRGEITKYCFYELCLYIFNIEPKSNVELKHQCWNVQCWGSKRLSESALTELRMAFKLKFSQISAMQFIWQRFARCELARGQPEGHDPGVHDDAPAHVTDHSMKMSPIKPEFVSPKPQRCNYFLNETPNFSDFLGKKIPS